MHSTILSVGQKMPAWCVEACNEYLKRLPRFFPCQLIEIPASGRSKTKTEWQCKKEEGEKILQKISPLDTVIALDLKGQQWSTTDLSQQMKNWQQDGKNLKFIIGGADGLSEDCIKGAQFHWCLSALTFPHAIARILVVEQLYRAATLLANHPYHRE